MAAEKSKRNCEDDNDSRDRSEIKRSKLVNNCIESDQEEDDDEARPIGDVIRVSSDGGVVKNHFKAFAFDGRSFKLEDAVLVTPEDGKVKPSVSIIKDIFQTEDGSVMVIAQRFYRPEETEKKGGGTWKSQGTRELFYSYQLDEFYASNVMHDCVIHIVPLHKQLPDRRQQPGFIVRKFYDHVQKKVRDLTNKDCKDILTQPPTF